MQAPRASRSFIPVKRAGPVDGLIWTGPECCDARPSQCTRALFHFQVQKVHPSQLLRGMYKCPVRIGKLKHDYRFRFVKTIGWTFKGQFHDSQLKTLPLSDRRLGLTDQRVWTSGHVGFDESLRTPTLFLFYMQGLDSLSSCYCYPVSSCIPVYSRSSSLFWIRASVQTRRFSSSVTLVV